MTNSFLQYSSETLKTLEKKYKLDMKDNELSKSVRESAEAKLKLVQEVLRAR
jgi:hypothetical protein